MPITKKEIDEMPLEELREKMYKMTSNSLFDSYFTWSDALAASNLGVVLMTKQLQEKAESGKIDDEYIKLQKEIADAGKRSLDLQGILNEMKKNFDPEELLKEEQRRLAAREGSVEEYAQRKGKIKNSRISRTV